MFSIVKEVLEVESTIMYYIKITKYHKIKTVFKDNEIPRCNLFFFLPEPDSFHCDFREVFEVLCI